MLKIKGPSSFEDSILLLATEGNFLKVIGLGYQAMSTEVLKISCLRFSLHMQISFNESAQVALWLVVSGPWGKLCSYIISMTLASLSILVQLFGRYLSLTKSALGEHKPLRLTFVSN